MVYLHCLRCDEVTEHSILGANGPRRIRVRCPECMKEHNWIQEQQPMNIFNPWDPVVKRILATFEWIPDKTENAIIQELLELGKVISKGVQNDCISFNDAVEETGDVFVVLIRLMDRLGIDASHIKERIDYVVKRYDTFPKPLIPLSDNNQGGEQNGNSN